MRDQTYRPLATFEEDVDVTTGAVPGVRLEGDSLSTWREGRLQLRTANSPTEGSSQYNNAVWLGWNNAVRGQDEPGPPAAFTLRLPEGMAADWRLDRTAALQFDLLPTNATPRPRSAPKVEGDSAAAPPPERNAEEEEAEGADENEEETPIDLSVEVEDAAGVSASVPLSRYGAVRRPLPIAILRRADIEKRQYGSLHELVFQTYTVPLADLAAVEPRLDLTTLRAVRFRFDRAEAGEVILDDVEFAHPSPAFLRGPVPVGEGQGAGSR